MDLQVDTQERVGSQMRVTLLSFSLRGGKGEHVISLIVNYWMAKGLENHPAEIGRWKRVFGALRGFVCDQEAVSYSRSLAVLCMRHDSARGRQSATCVSDLCG